MTAPPARAHWTLPWEPTGVISQTRSDDELLLDVGAGDHQAFATLYDHLAGLVYANIRRVVHDTARTNAVAEEAFIEVWRRAPRFDPLRTSAMTWILDIVHQLAVERVRHDESRADALPSGDRTDPRRSVPPASSGGEEPVRPAFAELTDQQQRAIELASVEGSTHHDLAAQLDTPVATVQTLLRDGLIHLRTGLQAREQRQ